MSEIPQHLKQLKITNSLTKKKELFQPINPPFVGMYVCGPTVYGESHLGHARTYISFDIAFRWLKHLGYKVRYVRNITDVGHLLGDNQEGDDRISKQARLEQKEPMEVAQYYSNGFHQDMQRLNNQPPSIEPLATGHIIEQISMIEKILGEGLAYESNGSVYFDVEAHHKKHGYGKLSGRNIEELLAQTRSNLVGGTEKKNPQDFALWKKASPEHLMRWPSPWGEGFPGWHLECSAMGQKYLGETFDIHGGGLDLLFPHHECEIAQSNAATGKDPVKTWMHTNMITVNGQKMGRSLNNAINLRQLFSGEHHLLDKAYSPMTVRYFILQAHYRGTLDFSNEALTAAYTAYRRLMNSLDTAKKLLTIDYTPNQDIDSALEEQIQKGLHAFYYGLNDDFNTAKALAALGNLSKRINSFYTQGDQRSKISREVDGNLLRSFISFIEHILGLKNEVPTESGEVIDGMLKLYTQAKETKDYDQVDKIRSILAERKVKIKDTKQGADWEWEI